MPLRSTPLYRSRPIQSPTGTRPTSTFRPEGASNNPGKTSPGTEVLFSREGAGFRTYSHSDMYRPHPPYTQSRYLRKEATVYRLGAPPMRSTSVQSVSSQAPLPTQDALSSR